MPPLEEQRVVGAVVLVAQDGERVYERAAGLADRERTVPMALDTVFRWSSLTKPIVAATVMALIERDGPAHHDRPPAHPQRRTDLRLRGQQWQLSRAGDL